MRGRGEKRINKLSKKIKPLSHLYEISKAISSSLDLKKVLELTLDKCLDSLESEAGSIFLLDEEGKELILKTVRGPKEVSLHDVKQRLGEGISGLVASNGKPLLVTDIENDPHFRKKRSDVLDMYETASFLCVPLVTTNQLVGVINITEKRSRKPYTRNDLEFLAALASHASLAIEKAQLYEQVRKFNEVLSDEVRTATEELKRRNEELFSLKEYNENIISSIGDGIVVIDKNWVIHTWNTGMERQFKIGEGEAKGKNILELLPEWEKAGLKEPIAMSLESGRLSEIERVRYKRKKGKLQTFKVKFSPLYDSQRKNTGAVIAITDISEKVELEKQLEISKRMASIGKLAAGVAHELNNPLDGAIRFANLTLDHTEEGDMRREYLLGAKEGLTRMAKIVASLLTFARQTNPTLELTDVNRVIDDALLFTEERIRCQDIKVVKELDKQLTPIMAGELQQVFVNLINNAFDAMPKGGTLKISTLRVNEKEGKFVKIIFEDTGHGIPIDIKDNIFDPFFTTKEVGKGVGLGLAICYGIIERYNGMIEVESNPGEGSTFIVKLPVTERNSDKEQNSG
ncbi:MAG: GAF domain-containing protein [Nitrospirae bacterium]|nr:GAF domain-containing protein [Nitrospirota bacterium]